MKAWPILLAILLATASASHAEAPTQPGASCTSAILSTERTTKLPPGLLIAIATVESGRPDPRDGRAIPWPWTINVAGIGFFYGSKQEAIAAVKAAQFSGVRSIDVGCMQINLMHHPAAFATLDDAFDPQANAVYAASFLNRLFALTGSWPEAAASYHSSTPGLREDYQRRVMQGWSGQDGRMRAGIGPSLPAGPRYTPAFQAQHAETRIDHARWAAMGLVPVAATPVVHPLARTRWARLAEAHTPISAHE